MDPLEEQLRQSLDELRAKRLVVLDEVLPPEALCKAGFAAGLRLGAQYVKWYATLTADQKG